MVDVTPWLIPKDRIMEIANAKGWFGVPRYKYRAETMARRCRELVNDGKLKRTCRHPEAGRDVIIYVPVKDDGHD